MIGQYSNEEFEAMVEKAGIMRAKINYPNKTAVIRYGRETHNYYHQHSDGSWTNYDCKTIPNVIC